MRGPVLSALLLPVLLASGATVSAAKRVDAVRRVAIFMKILAYDYNLEKRSPRGVRIGIVYQVGSQEGERVAKETFNVLRANQNMKVRGLDIFYFLLKMENEQELKQAVSRQGINNMILCPGLNTMMKSITALAAEKKILLFTSEEAYLSAGAAVGVIQQGKRPRIRVGLIAARAQGARFDARFLRIVDVVHPAEQPLTPN